MDPFPKFFKSYFNLLLLLLTLKSIAVIFFVIAAGIHLSPDEAQYWTWSQNLDFGYYSKPPGIAWQIFLTTHLLNNTEWGVRWGALLVSFLLSLSLYRLGKNAGLTQRGAFWGAVIFTFTPLSIYLTFAATTDGGAILGMVLALAFIAKGFTEKKPPNYLLVGLCLLMGALFKWTAFALWPFIFLFVLIYPYLRSKTLFVGFLISLCALLPSLYWNIFHDFATFKHVFFTVYPKGVSKGGNFFTFFASQIALLSPLTFLLLVMAIFSLFRQKVKKTALIFCATMTLAILIYFGLSTFKKMQANWAAFLYLPGMVLIGWYGVERLKKGIYWLVSATIISALMAFGAFLIPILQHHFPISYSLNPFRQTLGWDRLEGGLEKAGYNPKKDFLFSDAYQMTSLISFYGKEQKQGYFFNLQKKRKNQFSYGPQLQKEKGKTGFFVIAENVSEEGISWYVDHYLKRLSPYFEKVAFKEKIPLFEIKGKGVKYALIFEAIGYSGDTPADPEKY